MKSRTKARSEWLVEHLRKEHGYEKECPVREVRYEISDHVGGDSRTVEKYLHALVDYGLMKFKNKAIMSFCDSQPFNPAKILKNTLLKFLVIKDDDEPP